MLLGNRYRKYINITSVSDTCVQLMEERFFKENDAFYLVQYILFRLLLKNLQRTKKVEQNITSVTECCEKLSKRMERVRNN